MSADWESWDRRECGTRRPDVGSANPADGGSGSDGLRDLGHLVHDLEKVGELTGWGIRTDFD